MSVMTQSLAKVRHGADYASHGVTKRDDQTPPKWLVESKRVSLSPQLFATQGAALYHCLITRQKLSGRAPSLDET
jgi:hypothetical protein